MATDNEDDNEKDNAANEVDDATKTKNVFHSTILEGLAARGVVHSKRRKGKKNEESKRERK